MQFSIRLRLTLLSVESLDHGSRCMLVPQHARKVVLLQVTNFNVWTTHDQKSCLPICRLELYSSFKSRKKVWGHKCAREVQMTAWDDPLKSDKQPPTRTHFIYICSWDGWAEDEYKWRQFISLLRNSKFVINFSKSCLEGWGTVGWCANKMFPGEEIPEKSNQMGNLEKERSRGGRGHYISPFISCLFAITQMRQLVWKTKGKNGEFFSRI